MRIVLREGGKDIGDEGKGDSETVVVQSSEGDKKMKREGERQPIVARLVRRRVEELQKLGSPEVELEREEQRGMNDGNEAN